MVDAWKSKPREHRSNCNYMDRSNCNYMERSTVNSSVLFIRKHHWEPRNIHETTTVPPTKNCPDSETYSSTADLTSALLIFPPRPDARSRAPAFDIVDSAPPPPLVDQNAPEIVVAAIRARGGPSIGHGCTHVHPVSVAKRSNLVGKIMVRSEYKYHTLRVWVFDFAQQDGKGGE
jgi:hypothetical protein